MTSEEVLLLAKQAVLDGRCYPTKHCQDRMQDRNASVRDIKRAIRTANRAEETENGTWRIYGGKDSDDEDLVPVIKIEGTTIHLITILG
jgi:membrane protein implicated in regulation of membrane protease activity